MSQGDLPAATRVGRVALRVADLDRMTDFYADTVGLAVDERTDDRACLGAGAGDPFLELHASDAPDRAPDATGLFHTAFRVPDRTALGAALERVEAQWRLSGTSNHAVSEALYLQDPEGNGVELYRDTPRDAWPTTADGGVDIRSRALALDDIRAASDGAASVPTGTDVGHVHLDVSSIPAARGFYLDALGFRLRDTQTQGADTEALFVAADDYHHHLALNTWRERTAPAGGRGLAWFELLVPDANALDELRGRLDAAGVGFDADGPGVTVRDSDGIELRVRTQV